MPSDLRILWDQLHEDWTVHDRDSTKPGFRAVAVHRIGNYVRASWLIKRRSRIVGRILWALYLALYRSVRNRYGIELYHSTKLGRRVVIGHQNGIVIHPNAEIGDECLIRQNVTIGAATDTWSHEAPKLGARVRVGCGAVIVGNVVVGDGAIIGPNAVIMENVPAGARVFAESPRIMAFPVSR